MKTIKERIADKNWNTINTQLHDQGFVIVKNMLNKKECDTLIADYNAHNRYRKIINMQRYRFGIGEYKYFQYPLPGIITELRENV